LPQIKAASALVSFGALITAASLKLGLCAAVLALALFLRLQPPAPEPMIVGRLSLVVFLGPALAGD
jgi:hypothetical protein